MSDLGEDNELKVSVEDELNTIRGYKGSVYWKVFIPFDRTNRSSGL
jgi:hypothetical protein